MQPAGTKELQQEAKGNVLANNEAAVYLRQTSGLLLAQAGRPCGFDLGYVLAFEGWLYIRPEAMDGRILFVRVDMPRRRGNERHSTPLSQWRLGVVMVEEMGQ